jgi:hypothetical protein
MISVFWQQEPITQEQYELLLALFAAQHQAAYRENISSNVLVNTMIGSGDYCKAVAAAILTLGNLHAPIAQSMRLLALKDPVVEAVKRLESGKLVPGWGSWFPSEPEVWAPVRDKLTERMRGKIDAVTALLHERGKNIEPNPSTWTAATALHLRIPVTVAPWLLINGRLGAWGSIALRAAEGRV